MKYYNKELRSPKKSKIKTWLDKYENKHIPEIFIAENIKDFLDHGSDIIPTQNKELLSKDYEGFAIIKLPNVDCLADSRHRHKRKLIDLTGSLDINVFSREELNQMTDLKKLVDGDETSLEYDSFGLDYLRNMELFDKMPLLVERNYFMEFFKERVRLRNISLSYHPKTKCLCLTNCEGIETSEFKYN